MKKQSKETEGVPVTGHDRIAKEALEPVGKVRFTSNGFKCRGCNARVTYAGDYCWECICEDDGI